MKQRKLISFALAGILLLSGCSSKTVQEDGKDVVAAIDKTNLLADDLYQDLATSTQGKQALFSYVLEQQVFNHHIKVEYIIDMQAKCYNQKVTYLLMQ